jgi:hypothetical protein
MDNKTEQSKWAWLPKAMPKVAQLLAEKRVSMGAAHVQECWKRGVLNCEPGWFFAREAGLSVGVPWGDLAALWADVDRPQQVLLALKPLPQEHTNGA